MAPTLDEFLKEIRDYMPAHAKSERDGLKGEEGAWSLTSENGQMGFYFISDLDLVTDGGEDPGIRFESTHQSDTTLHHRSGEPLNSNKVPFVVLPLGTWRREHGIKLGDFGYVAYNGRVVAVIAGDLGPRTKLGEGSIALHRALGFERVRNGRIRDIGIEGGVRTLMFPGSGDGFCPPNAEIESRAARLWELFKVAI